MGQEYTKAFSDEAIMQKEIKTLSLGERLGEINNRLSSINGTMNDYERAIGEYANNSLDVSCGSPSDAEDGSPTISELIKQISRKITWIETTCDNLNRHIAR